MQVHILRDRSGKILAAGVAAPDVHVKLDVPESASKLRLTSVDVPDMNNRQCHTHLRKLVEESNAGGGRGKPTSRKELQVRAGRKKRR